MLRFKGGDVAYVESMGAFYVRTHSRSLNLLRADQNESSPSFIRLDSSEIEKLSPITIEHTNYITHNGPDDMPKIMSKIKEMGTNAVRRGLILEAVQIPSVAMSSAITLIVISKKSATEAADVVLATDSTKLTKLITDSVNTINKVVYQKMEDRTFDLQETKTVIASPNDITQKVAEAPALEANPAHLITPRM